MEEFKEITFDVNREIRTIYQIAQYDESTRGFIVTYQSDGVDKEITTEKLVFQGLKADGKKIIQEAEVIDGKFVVSLPRQAATMPGVMLAQLTLLGEMGERLSDKKFKILVDRDVFGEGLISEDERGILDRAFDLASDIVPRLEALDVPLLENLEQRFDNLITTPVPTGEIIAEEIIDARDGEVSVGAKIRSVDAQLAQTVKKNENEQITKPMLSKELLDEIALGEINVNVNTSMMENYSVTAEKTEFIRTGSNLFDRSTAQLNARVSDKNGIVSVPSIGYFTSDYILVLPNTEYTLPTFSNIVYYDHEKKYISGIGSTIEPHTITTPLNCIYIRVSGRMDEARESNIMNFRISKGDSLKEYENFGYKLNKHAPNSIDISTLANSSKFGVGLIEGFIGRVGSLNRYDKDSNVKGGYFDGNTGTFVDNIAFSSTDFMSCVPGDTFYKPYNSGHITYWDKDFNFLVGEIVSNSYFFTVPLNKNIVYMRTSIRNSTDTGNMIIKTDVEPEEYIPYEKGSSRTVDVDDRVKVGRGNLKNGSVTSEKLSQELLDDIALVELPTQILSHSERYGDLVSIDYYRDEVSGTSYQITRITRRKFDGTSIVPKVELTSGGISNNKTLSTLAYLEENDHMVGINAGIFNTSTHIADGFVISEGAILQDIQSTTHQEQYTLGVKGDGKLKAYPHTVSAEDVLADGVVNAVVGFVPIIEDSEKTSNAILSLCPHAFAKHPRQVIAQAINGDYIILTCDGRTTNEAGMDLLDCQRILQDYHSVVFAYNLDGGGSTSTVVSKKHINRVIEGSKGRRVPTILTFD